MMMHTSLIDKLKIGAASLLMVASLGINAAAAHDDEGNPTLLVGKLEAKSGTNLTVKAEDKTLTVTTEGAVVLGKLDEIETLVNLMLGDHLRLRGTLSSDGMTFAATMIRDLTVLHPRRTVFGTVTATSDTSFTLAIRHDSTVTVTLTTNARLTNRRERKINLADIKVGDVVRVTGIWDTTAKTISAVTRVKDFSLPVQPQSHRD